MSGAHAWPAIAAILAAPAAAQSSVTAPVWTGRTLPEWRTMDEIEMSGVIEDGHFRPLSLAAPAAPATRAPPLVPLGSDILPLARHRPFGREGRVSVTATKTGLSINCAAGEAPAGVLLDWPGYDLPQRYRGRWAVVGSGARLGIAAVVPGSDAPPSPAMRLSDGVGLGYDASHGQLVVSCPSSVATAHLSSIAIEPIATAGTATARGTWVWDERDWRNDPERLARLATAAGWNQLAVQAPAKPGQPLVRLAAALAQAGIALYLVDGDPAMASASGAAAAAARFAALRTWRDHHLPLDRPPELELDIEPYGLRDFGRDPASAWRGWADAVREIAAAWGAPVAVDVPWWMNRSEGGRDALTRAGDAVSHVVVMAYRTDPQLIVDAAAPWLSDGRWPISVAIETGPVAREATRRYRRADRGTLRLDADGAALFDRPQPGSTSAATFSLTGESATDPGRVSFHDAPARAGEVEQMLAPIFSGWSAYSGWRVHGWTIAAKEDGHG